MNRFLLKAIEIKESTITVTDKDLIHYILDVMRFKAGDRVGFFDGKGTEYRCLIDKVLDGKMLFTVEEVSSGLIRDNTFVTVACAIPKKSKFDDIVDKLVQLGANRIIPLNTQRVIVKIDKAKSALRKARWQKIAEAALQQSQRSDSVTVECVKDLKSVLSDCAEYDVKLIATLIGHRKPLREALKDKKQKKVLILIGPEGDFTQEEVDFAMRAGCVAVSLGGNVLRVETAAVAVLSYIMLDSA